MSNLLSTVIAILLASLIAVSGFVYYDGSSIAVTVLAERTVHRLNEGAEVVARYSMQTGQRPQTLADLQQGGLADIDISGAQWGIACGGTDCAVLTLCVSMPSSKDNVEAAGLVANRMSAAVSGTCGSPSAAVGANVVVGLPIDGDSSKTGG